MRKRLILVASALLALALLVAGVVYYVGRALAPQPTYQARSSVQDERGGQNDRGLLDQ
jgi:lipopolysaccharide export LptBFGC system permease protein LptF